MDVTKLFLRDFLDNAYAAQSVELVSSLRIKAQLTDASGRREPGVGNLYWDFREFRLVPSRTPAMLIAGLKQSF